MASDLEDILKELGAEKSSAAGWRARCPTHADSTPSLHIFKDHRGGTRFHCYAGCAEKEICDHLRAKGFTIAEASTVNDRLVYVFRTMAPIEGTPAQVYLQSRGITKIPPADLIGWLKPGLKDLNRWSLGHGGIVFIARNAKGELVSAQIVFLTEDGQKALLKNPKWNVCPFHGECMRLPGDAGALPVYVEGPEDALSVWQATGRRTLCAFGNKFGNLNLVAGEKIVIARDNDPIGSRGEKTFWQQVRSLRKREVTVFVATPPAAETQKKTDCNDILKLQGDAGVVTFINAAAEVKGPNAQDISRAGSIEEKDALEMMNGKYAVVLCAGKAVILKEEHDPELDRDFQEYMNFADMRNFYMNKMVRLSANEGVDRAKPLAKWWLEHNERRQYEKVVFAPGARESTLEYNLWQGWAYDPEEGDWSMLKEHLFENIVGGNQDHYDWFMNWLARGIQRVDLHAETAPVLRGKRGVGKGVLANAYGDLFGQHFLPLTQSAHLTGRYNAHLQDALFIFVDEGFWAGDKQAEGTLKALVTEPMIAVEKKFMDVIPRKNRTKLLIASNEDWVVPAGMEERRFGVFDVKDTKMQDIKYFTAMKAQLDAGGCEGMLHELTERDISGWNHRIIPKTAALIAQKVRSMDVVAKWWLERLNDGRLGEMNEWPALFSVIQVYESFQNWVGKYRGYTPARDEFMQRLGKLTPMDLSGRSFTLTLPPLEECRKFFEEKVLHQEYLWMVAENADITAI